MLRNQILALLLALSTLSVVLVAYAAQPRPVVTDDCPVCALAADELPALVDVCTGETHPLHPENLPRSDVFQFLSFAGGGCLDRAGDIISIRFRAAPDTGATAYFCPAHHPPRHGRYLLAGVGEVRLLRPRRGEYRAGILLQSNGDAAVLLCSAPLSGDI